MQTNHTLCEVIVHPTDCNKYEMTHGCIPVQFSSAFWYTDVIYLPVGFTYSFLTSHMANWWLSIHWTYERQNIYPSISPAFCWNPVCCSELHHDLCFWIIVQGLTAYSFLKARLSPAMLIITSVIQPRSRYLLSSSLWHESCDISRLIWFTA
jgi:hypothetical protein